MKNLIRNQVSTLKPNYQFSPSIISVFLALLLITFTSCKKESTTPAGGNPVSPACRVSVIDDYPIEYHTNGSINKIGPFQYTHSENEVRINGFDETQELIFKMNAMGYPEKLITYGEDTVELLYTYNEQGYLTKQILIFSGFPFLVSDISYVNNNMTSIKQTSLDGEIINYTFTYDVQKNDSRSHFFEKVLTMNVLGQDFNLFLFPGGKQSEKLIKNITKKEGSIETTFDVTYEFDAKGNVSKQTITDEWGDMASLNNYSFKCNN